MSVVRFGVSLEQNLLEALDEFVTKNKFSNRSQAIRQLIAKNVVIKKWECNNIVAGSITLAYNHHKREILLQQLNDIQHEFCESILSSMHIHLDNDNCMEIVAVKGKAVTLTELADRLIAVKGISHGKLTMSRVG